VTIGARHRAIRPRERLRCRCEFALDAAVLLTESIGALRFPT